MARLRACWLFEYDNREVPVAARCRGRQRLLRQRAVGTSPGLGGLSRRPLPGSRRGRVSRSARIRLRQRLYEDYGRSLWYEEYPACLPLRVLNGHIYCLLGVLDYARVTGDVEAEARWRRAAATALESLPDFDLGYWSAYELRWKEPATVHYQKNIHVPQLRILAQLTGNRIPDVADRWERQAHSKLSRLRWRAAIRVHGRRNRRSM